jgi:AcrR family transcriptional regulator
MSIKVVLSEKPSFTTDKGLIRAQEILFAAHRILATKGYAGLSMRGVATYLQISLSTVQHYYKSKELLVEALLSYVLDSYQRSIADLIQSMTEKNASRTFYSHYGYVVARD